MDIVSRELIAYALIAVMLVIAAFGIAVSLRRRHRQRLRQRGIKRYGH